MTNQTQVQHSPTPWRRVILSGAIEDATGAMLASVYDPGNMLHLTDTTEANAEFIVRAVNSHDDLLAALNQAVQASHEVVRQLRDAGMTAQANHLMEYVIEPCGITMALARARGED